MRRRKGCNVQLLTELVKSSGQPVVKIAELAGVSEALLGRLLRKQYNYIVKEENRVKLCDFFQVAESELFPLET